MIFPLVFIGVYLSWLINAFSCLRSGLKRSKNEYSSCAITRYQTPILDYNPTLKKECTTR